MTPRMLRNAGLTSITALSLALVACGGSSSSTPATPANKAPEWKSLPTSAPALITGHGAVQVGVSAVDPDGDTVTYTATSSNTAVLTVSMTGTVITGTPVKAGSAVITVEAKDGKGGVTTGSISVNVTENKLPVVGGLTNATVQAGNSLSLPLTVTDGDGDAVTLALAGTANPAWISLSGNTLVVKPAVTVTPGSYEVKLEAKDGFGGVTPVSAFITVTAIVNTPPGKPAAAKDLANQNPHVGREMKWFLGAYDQEDGAVKAFEQSPLTDPEVRIEGNVLIYKPTQAQGPKKIYVVAKDSRGAMSVEPLVIETEAVTKNTAPSWLSGANSGMPEDHEQDNGKGWASNPNNRWTGGVQLVDPREWFGLVTAYPEVDGTIYAIQGAKFTWDAADLLKKRDLATLPPSTLVTPGTTDLFAIWNAGRTSVPAFAAATDPDTQDTLSFSLVERTGGTMPASSLGIDGPTGVISFTPTSSHVDKVAAFRIRANDGLDTRDTHTYYVAAKANTAPVIRETPIVPGFAQYQNWFDPYSATAYTVSAGSFVTSVDAEGDGVTWFIKGTDFPSSDQMEVQLPSNKLAAEPPFVFDNTNVDEGWIGKDKAEPFKAYKLSLTASDIWGASVDQDITLKAFGQAKVKRYLTYNDGENTYGVKDLQAAVAQRDGYQNCTEGTTTVPVGDGTFMVNRLVAKNYWLKYTGATNRSKLGVAGFNFLPMDNGGTGETTATLDETILGRKDIVNVNNTGETYTGLPYASTNQLLNPKAAYSTIVNAASGFAATANVLDPATPAYPVPAGAGDPVFVGDLAAKTWTGNTGGASTPQGFFAQAGFSTATLPAAGAAVALTSVAAGTPVEKAYNLYWDRKSFETALGTPAGMDFATKQIHYVGMTPHATMPYITLAEEMAFTKAAFDAPVMPREFAYLYYQPSGALGSASDASRVLPVAMKDLIYQAIPTDSLLSQTVYYTTVHAMNQGQAFDWTYSNQGRTGDVAPMTTIGVRTKTPSAIGAPFVPKIGKPALKSLIVGDDWNASVATVDISKNHVRNGALSSTASYLIGKAINGAKLSWAAPSTGTVAEYEIDIYRTGTFTFAWTAITGASPVAAVTDSYVPTHLARFTVSGTTTELNIPEPRTIFGLQRSNTGTYSGISGVTFYIRVRAKAAAGNPIEQAWADNTAVIMM